MLLEAALTAGVHVLQPFTVMALAREGDHVRVCATCKESPSEFELRSNVVIAAHGSWEAGSLPTQSRRRAPRASDLFGFKAHFVHSNIPDGLMPLLAFPGGYGGMVHCDGGRASLSCCIRRG